MYFKCSLYFICDYKEIPSLTKKSNYLRKVNEVKNFFRMILTVKILKKLVCN